MNSQASSPQHVCELHLCRLISIVRSFSLLSNVSLHGYTTAFACLPDDGRAVGLFSDFGGYE